MSLAFAVARLAYVWVLYCVLQLRSFPNSNKLEGEKTLLVLNMFFSLILKDIKLNISTYVRLFLLMTKSHNHLSVCITNYHSV